MTTRKNIEFGTTVERYSSMSMMLAHENYFDVVMEENLLAAIRTKSIRGGVGKSFERRFEKRRYIFFHLRLGR